VEIGHDLLHLRLYLILSDVQFLLHDLSSLTLSAVFIEAAGEFFHGASLSQKLLLFFIDTL
jgi:hypothetical protein